MLDFYKTGGGRRFCDATMPEIGRQLKRVADELKRANTLKEIELGIRSKPRVPAWEDEETSPADALPGVTPEDFVSGLLSRGLLSDLKEENGITIRRAAMDFLMFQNQKVRELLLAAGVRIEESEDRITLIGSGNE
jgi:hypothetical protein